jgi:hypothetical protein
MCVFFFPKKEKSVIFFNFTVFVLVFLSDDLVSLMEFVKLAGNNQHRLKRLFKE